MYNYLKKPHTVMVIAKQYLTEIIVQRGIKAFIKYIPEINSEKTGFRIRTIDGTASIMSLFSEKCTGTDNVKQAIVCYLIFL